MANSDNESNISLSTFIPSSIRPCSVHELQSTSSARNDCENISERGGCRDISLLILFEISGGKRIHRQLPLGNLISRLQITPSELTDGFNPDQVHACQMMTEVRISISRRPFTGGQIAFERVAVVGMHNIRTMRVHRGPAEIGRIRQDLRAATFFVINTYHRLPKLKLRPEVAP